MIARRLLYLNTHNLAAYLWQKGKLIAEGVFDNSTDGLERFSAYLTDSSSSHFYLLANVAEEGHVMETIPFLRGDDRKALIKRKIGQHFLGTPFAAAVSLGYEKNLRKNEKLLINGLTNPDFFEPWLQRIRLAAAPLAGLYSIAQLGGTLLKKIGVGKGRCLLLTQQDHSIRETYLIDGEAVFSRMVSLTDSSIAGIASSLASEAGKLQQYLIGQRLIGRNDTLPVFIVSHPQALSTIEKALPAHTQLKFALIDSHQVACQIKLDTLPSDSRSENLYLHLLASSPPKQQFATEEHRHDFRLSQIRQTVIGLGLIALLGSLLLSAKDVYRSHELNWESVTLAASNADFESRYKETAATFPKIGIDNEALRLLTNRYQELKAQQYYPDAAFRRISRALDQSPEIELDELKWQIETPQSTSSNTLLQEQTQIRGTVRAAPKATTRQIINTFEDFVASLRLDSANTVSVEQSPFDITPSHTLRGGDTEDGTKQARQFSLKITRKLTP
ncbi:MAG: hypothetical protein D3M94_21265 [Rhodocyclales bacterium GT-UBC]|nr:MAG: hypothetical protein D3M94_21265 [Rhodocyclales bacterium GT-UBC]